MTEKVKSKKQLQDYVKRNKLAGLEDITAEEFEDSNKYSIRVALHRILKKRQGVHKAKEFEDWKGILLGGRDFVYKGIQIDEARTQYVTLLRNDADDGKPFLDEVTIWGHMKDAKHGDGSEMKIEIKESTLKDGSVRTNQTVRNDENKLPVLKEGLVKTYKDIKDGGVYIFAPEDVSEDQLYDVIAVEGVVTNVDACPKWSKDEQGQREGDYPVYYNEQACLQFILRSQGSTRIRVSLNPKKHSDLLISWPEDFDEVIKTNELQEALATFIDAKVLVIGCIRKFDMGSEGNFANIDATAIFVPDEIYADSEVVDTEQTTTEDSSEEEVPTEKETPAEDDPAIQDQEKDVGETAEEKPPEATPQTAVKSKMDEYKEVVGELMDTLSKDDIELEDVRSAKILPEDLGDALVKGLINNVKKSRSS